MIINPSHIISRGIISNAIYEHGDAIDLTVEQAFEAQDCSMMNNKIEFQYIELLDTTFKLLQGRAYSVLFRQQVFLPSNITAMVVQRSTLNRAGVIVTGSIYDGGYQGQVGATVYPFINIEIPHGSRIAQMMFLEKNYDSQYNGQYQNEHLEEK